MNSLIIVIIAVIIASAYSWMPTKARSTSPSVTMSSTNKIEGRSASIPFMKRPPNLDGSLVGDVGFDPLNLSSIQDFNGIDLYWMREAELKHGRVAMLASLGFIAQEKGLFLLSSDNHNQITNFYLFARAYPSSIGFFLVFIGIAELFSGIAITEGRKSGDREPGYFGFNPLKFGSKEATYRDLSLKEIKNGRLAMIASAGMLLQSTISSDAGVLDNLGNF